MDIIDFTVFSYCPSVVTNERMNLGVLFHDAKTDECKFEHIANWSRLKHFDEQLDIDFVKDYLRGIKKQLEPSLLANAAGWIPFIHRFVNEFKFSAITTVSVENKASFIDETRRIYLRMGSPEDKPLKSEEQRSFILKLLKGTNVAFSTEPIKGKYSEPIRCDYRVDDICFKHFDFDNKNVARMMQSIHAWRDIAAEISDTCKTIFVYDSKVLDNPDLILAVRMLKDSAAKVVQFSNALEFITTLNSAKSSKTDVLESLVGIIDDSTLTHSIRKSML